MNNKNQDIESIIYDLSVDQIDDLILELDLKHKYNFRFHYIIDPYDLSNYCFPFGILDSVKDSNKEREVLSIPSIADEQIAYDQIFVKAKSLCFILDEHYKEVIDFQKFYMHIQTMHGKKLINTAQKLASFYEEGATSFDKINTLDDIEPDQLSLLYSIALNSAYTGREKFNNLVTNKRIIVSIDELNTIESFDKELLKELFSSCKSSELSKHLNKLAVNFYNPENKYDAKVKVHLKSLDRDFRAIDRILKLNSKSIENNENTDNKPLFLYLSNTRMSKTYFQDIFSERGNNDLISFLKEVNVTIKNSFSVILEKQLNPHRTPAQIYLQLLLETENGGSTKNVTYIKTHERLKYFRDFIANFTIKKLDVSKSRNIEKINELIFKHRSNFDGYLLLEKHKEFNSNFRNAVENRSFASFKKLVKNFQSLNDLFKTNIIEKKINEYINSSFWIISLSQITKTFLTFLSEASKDGPSFQLRGTDKISAIYHALPIVFFNNEFDNNFCDDILNDFIDNLTETQLNQAIIAENLLTKISNFENFRNYDSTNCFEDTATIMNIIVLLLVDEHHSLHINSYELTSRFINYNLVKYKQNETKKANYLYLQAWIYRRKNNIDKARRISLKGHESNKNDPRFIHSLALLDYCEFLHQENKVSLSKQIEFITNSIQNFEKALRLYDSIKSINESIKKKTRYVILNSISYSRLLLFKLNNEVINLNLARDFLNKLKEELSENEFDNIAEFLHTEAFIEYHEALWALKSNDILKAAYKSTQALDEIKKAISCANKELYWKLKDEIVTLFEEIKRR